MLLHFARKFNSPFHLSQVLDKKLCIPKKSLDEVKANNRKNINKSSKRAEPKIIKGKKTLCSQVKLKEESKDKQQPETKAKIPNGKTRGKLKELICVNKDIAIKGEANVLPQGQPSQADKKETKEVEGQRKEEESARRLPIAAEKRRKSQVRRDKPNLNKKLNSKIDDNSALTCKSLSHGKVQALLKPKWSNGWSWEGESFEAKVYLTVRFSLFADFCRVLIRN